MSALDGVHTQSGSFSSCPFVRPSPSESNWHNSVLHSCKGKNFSTAKTVDLYNRAGTRCIQLFVCRDVKNRPQLLCGSVTSSLLSLSEDCGGDSDITSTEFCIWFPARHENLICHFHSGQTKNFSHLSQSLEVEAKRVPGAGPCRVLVPHSVPHCVRLAGIRHPGAIGNLLAKGTVRQCQSYEAGQQDEDLQNAYCGAPMNLVKNPGRPGHSTRIF